MTRLIVLLIGLVTFIFTGLSLAALTFGTRQPPHFALSGFQDGCLQTTEPCWYGIIPGVTPVDDANHILETLGYQVSLHKTTDFILRYRSDRREPGCVDMYVGYGIVEVRSLTLGCLEARSGDILAQMGLPKGIVYNALYGETMVYPNLLAQSSAAGHSLYEPIISVYVLRLNLIADNPWPGLKPLWRYCQLQRDYSGCR
jgi:hypothetical protein